MQPSPRRSRALQPIRALLTLIIVGNALGLLAMASNWITRGRTPVQFWAPLGALVNPLPDPLQPGLDRHVDVDVAVAVADPSLLQTALETVAVGAVSVLFWLVIAVLALRIVTSALQADPFTVSTADRIRRLSIIILIGGALTEAVRAGATVALYRSVFSAFAYQGPVKDTFNFWWLPLGFAVLAFAAVVRHGCALRAELDDVI